MRKVLNNLNIVGATLVYSEGNQCRMTIEWLCNFCDKVIVLLDNYNSDTENIVLEYKKKFPDKVNIIYSTVPIDEDRNKGSYIKQRFKNCKLRCY